MPDWMKNKLESRFQGEISLTSDMQICRYAEITLMAESEEELKSFLMKVKEESEKDGLNLNFQNLEKVEIVTDFIFLASKITADHGCSHKVKRRLLLGRKAMIKIDSMLKSRHITLPTKVHLVKATSIHEWM